MEREDRQEAPPVVVTQGALRQIERRLKVRLRAFFRPGERIRIEIEDEADFVFARLSLVSAAKDHQLDLEAAVIEQDQDHRFVEATTSRARLLGAIEFLAAQLEDYFRGDRQARFHIDWRLYDFEAATIRFRGQHRRPNLEEKATSLLEEKEPRK